MSGEEEASHTDCEYTTDSQSETSFSDSVDSDDTIVNPSSLEVVVDSPLSMHTFVPLLLSGCFGICLQTLAIAYTFQHVPMQRDHRAITTLFVILTAWLNSGCNLNVPPFFVLGLYMHALTETQERAPEHVTEDGMRAIGAFSAATIITPSLAGALMNVFVALYIHGAGTTPAIVLCGGFVRNSLLEIKKYFHNKNQ